MIPACISVYDRVDMVDEVVESMNTSNEIGTVHLLHTGPGTIEHEEALVHDVADDGWAHDAHNAAPEIVDSDLYLFTDADQPLIGSIDHIVSAIRSDDGIGAISSPLIETDRVFYMAGNFREADGGLYREAVDMPEIKVKDGHPFAVFDFASTACVYRTDFVSQVRWDDRYRMGLAQDDFYLKNWKNYDWDILVTFTPVFQHNTGGRESLQHKRTSRNEYSLDQFLQKWDYDFWETKSPWMSSNYEPRDDYERAAWYLRESGPLELVKRGIRKYL